MRNPDHVKIYQLGLEAWNEWRGKNPEVQPELGKASLWNQNLDKIDFSKADLCGASIFKTSLREANLKGVWLENAKIQLSDLTEANLSGADLIYAAFKGSCLENTNLKNADLHGALLNGANLKGANLVGANLRRASLVGADLRDADLTGAKLYGTSRDDWRISGIKCDYVYWDKAGGERTPANRNFETGEFDSLHKSLPTLEYYFENGFTPIDAVMMDKIVQQITERHPEFELKLDSFHSRGTPRAVFTVLHKEVADQAFREIKHDYEKKLAVIEADRDRLERCFAMAIEQPKQMIGRLEMGDTIHGDQIKGTQGDAFIAKDQATVNIQNITNPVAKDLLEQISKLIQKDDVPDDDKADAQQQLSNMVKELEKPQPEESRLKRFYNRMIEVVPKIAEKLPWDKIAEKLLLG